MGATVPYAQLPQNANIIHRWRMEEEGGTRYDSVGGMHNKNANPSIEVSTSGYTGYQSTISRDTTEYKFGIASLKTITNGVGVAEGWKRNVTSESLAGTQYTFSDYLKGSGSILLRFYDNVSGAQQSGTITLTSTWTRYNITKTFSAGSTIRELQIVTPTTQAITFYSDAIMHSLGSTLYPFSMKLNLTDNNTVLSSPVSMEGNRCADFELDNLEYLSASGGDSADMNFTSENFSISFGVRPESLATIQYFLCRGLDVTDGWSILYDTYDTIAFVSSKPTWQEFYSDQYPLTVEKDSLITVVRNGTTGYIYKDGLDITIDSSVLGNIITSARSLYIGRYDTAGQYLDALKDDLIIWKGVALSPAEVKGLNGLYVAKKRLIPMYV